MFSKQATKIYELFTVDLKSCTCLVSVKSTVKISLIFLAFLENTIFKKKPFSASENFHKSSQKFADFW